MKWSFREENNEAPANHSEVPVICERYLDIVVLDVSSKWALLRIKKNLS